MTSQMGKRVRRVPNVANIGLLKIRMQTADGLGPTSGAPHGSSTRLIAPPTPASAAYPTFLDANPAATRTTAFFGVIHWPAIKTRRTTEKSH
jgi:hypothetical protein